VLVVLGPDGPCPVSGEVRFARELNGDKPLIDREDGGCTPACPGFITAIPTAAAVIVPAAVNATRLGQPAERAALPRRSMLPVRFTTYVRPRRAILETQVPARRTWFSSFSSAIERRRLTVLTETDSMAAI